jgi:hypothetical protein
MKAADWRKKMGLPPPGQHDHQARARLPHPQPAKPAPALDKDHAGEAPRPGRPLVRFELYRVRLLDADAKHGSCKDLLDALQHAGAICGDREDQIRLEVEQVRVSHFHEERTEITITYPTP